MHAALVKKLLLTAIGMFAFAFALVPLYDVFCEVTGLNGKPDMEAAQASSLVDETRNVDVSFITQTKDGVPFSVKAKQFSVAVKPGEMSELTFIAKNLSAQQKVMQAIPSVSPGKAAKYLHKVACFCFDRQPFEPNQEVEFKLVFYVDTSLPHDVEELTLSYAIFDISDVALQRNEEITEPFKG
ncbi:MAG: cytochrome c oxidase assembly protein [Pseudoalteromonas sp.]|uniref:cytochrome c oxidase assembly protein n=1 Tax=Pseudoalteromonas phenolica TaxID=161398 RepID=UPI000C0ADF18|nr:cytochrome c oxidase assembly protein [Pseudoalteromonas sp.]|tara:strand:+ start:2807 stop:3358 length:552 start_codon:yes stop_codon:yes gene_type:complete